MSKKTIFWIKAAVTVSLLGLMYYTIRPGAILSAFRSAEYSLVIAALLLMPLNIWLQEYKWRYLVRLIHPGVTIAESFGSLLGGFAFGIVTPGRLGEYGRGLFVKHNTLNLVGLTIIDKFYNLGCTIAFGLPALMTLPWMNDLMNTDMIEMELFISKYHLYISMLILMSLLNLLLIYLALDPRPVRSLIYSLQISFPRRNRITQLAHGLDYFNAPQARMVLLLTLAHYVVFLAQYYLLIRSFAQLNILTSIRGAASILFAKSALPIAIADLGVDQLVAVQFFGQFGASPEAAFNASILLFAMNVLIPALVGVSFIGRIQFDKHKKEL
ncbi:MAG: flippase-like domain-containing protein [Calditrichaeota bacterium]|nr:flippase-like domain-containing protein [Calditrichota bacterium]